MSCNKTFASKNVITQNNRVILLVPLLQYNWIQGEGLRWEEFRDPVLLTLQQEKLGTQHRSVEVKLNLPSPPHRRSKLVVRRVVHNECIDRCLVQKKKSSVLGRLQASTSSFFPYQAEVAIKANHPVGL